MEEFQPLEQFFAKVEQLVALVKSKKPAPGHDEILLPGEKARRTEATQLKDGVEIDEGTWTQLTKLAAELSVKDAPNAL